MDIENHMVSREEYPTNTDLRIALELAQTKHVTLTDVSAIVENLALDSDTLMLDQNRIGTFLTYLSGEIGDCETELNMIHRELAARRSK